MKIRLAYSKNISVTFTKRGKEDDRYAYGFVRLDGKTVSGYAFKGLSNEWTFFPQGKHRQMAFDIGTANLRAARMAA